MKFTKKFNPFNFFLQLGFILIVHLRRDVLRLCHLLWNEYTFRKKSFSQQTFSPILVISILWRSFRKSSSITFLFSRDFEAAKCKCVRCLWSSLVKSLETRHKHTWLWFNLHIYLPAALKGHKNLSPHTENEMKTYKSEILIISAAL